jgi:hypothetical protein
MVTSGTGHDRCPPHFPGPEAPEGHPTRDGNSKFVGAKKVSRGRPKIFWGLINLLNFLIFSRSLFQHSGNAGRPIEQMADAPDQIRTAVRFVNDVEFIGGAFRAFKQRF